MDLEKAKALLKVVIPKHHEFHKQAEEAEKYYRNKGKILHTGAAAIDSINHYLATIGQNPLKSADNRVPLNWHKILVDQKIGYLFTYPPQFEAEGSEVDFKDILGDEYTKIIKKVGVDASNCGCGWIHYWKGEKGKRDYHYVDPKQIVAIHDETKIKRPLKLLIRYYTAIGEDNKTYTRYEIWDDKETSFFFHEQSKDVDCLNIELMKEEAKIIKHGYGEIPFIKFSNNDVDLPDLDMYKAIIDCLDKVWSGFANDIDDIQEIIWVLKNYTSETGSPFKLDDEGLPILDEEGKPIKQEGPDFLQMLKAKKRIEVTDGGGVETITGEIPYDARTKFIEGLTRQLFVSAMAVDPNPESAGNASGVYIEFLYSLLELKAGLMETEFRGALGHLVRALGELSNDVKIVQTWSRNRPKNDAEIAGILSSTSPTVMSDQTKTKNHPYVDDWENERKQIDKEQKELSEVDEPLFAEKNKGKLNE